MSFLPQRTESGCRGPMPAVFAALLFALLLSGCALRGVPKANPSDSAVTPNGLLVFGKINYVIDGRVAAPYGASGAAPAPSLTLFNLDTGKQVRSGKVLAEDGSFVWRLPPGHYVITGIGPDEGEYHGAWPQVALSVPPVVASIYLGHLQLLGTRYTETLARPDGKTETYSSIRYTYTVLDEFDAANAWMRGVRGSSSRKSLMFVDPGMPVGQTFAEGVAASRTGMIERIFGTREAPKASLRRGGTAHPNA
jgi:hypothetical protein